MLHAFENPLEHGPKFAEARADIVTLHMEVNQDPDRVMDAIEARGARGAALARLGEEGLPFESVLTDRCCDRLLRRCP